MNLQALDDMHAKDSPAGDTGELEQLVQRVASSSTLVRSPRLRAFFLHVCACALEGCPEQATEQQIGVLVYHRKPGYNPTEDNIVRSQARILRMKLEHHFGNEGKAEPISITIPKGHYLPLFEPRRLEPPPLPVLVPPLQPKEPEFRWWPVAVGAFFAVSAVLLVYFFLQPRHGGSSGLASVAPRPVAESGGRGPAPERVPVVPEAGVIRIAAGHSGLPYIDGSGRSWEADRYFTGGESQAGPQHFFPAVADDGFLRSMRGALSGSDMVPKSERSFRYDIPLKPGVYQLRLYFADPLRQPDGDQEDDAENLRHFLVEMNGRPLLKDFDPISDAGRSAVDVRAFRDVRPMPDGKLHLVFSSDSSQAFVTALEVTPGVAGKMMPIRISAGRSTDLVDGGGVRWSADEDYINGRRYTYLNPETGIRVPALYATERHGNFSYALPVPPGSYTVRLHFLESFFSSQIPAAHCAGVGCRVFDVSCNGVMLLHNFDVTQAAGGAFRPVVREFHGLRPNGQGKLLVSFSPIVNYAEVRAIEVIDEGK